VTAEAVLPVAGSLPYLHTNLRRSLRSTCPAAATNANPALTTPASSTVPAAATTLIATRTAAYNRTPGTAISPGLMGVLAWDEATEQRRADLTWQQCYLLTDSAS